MKRQMCIEFIILNPKLILHISWLWWGGTACLASPDGIALLQNCLWISSYLNTYLTATCNFTVTQERNGVGLAEMYKT